MQLLFIRHAEPDYEHDTITEKGWKEAELLSESLAKIPVTKFYVSPLGRARDTASLTLKKMGRTAEEKEWLKEFPVRINRPDRTDIRKIAWDWLPQDWTARKCFYSLEEWDKDPVMMEAHAGEEYRRVISEFDSLLADHGYIREGEYYRAERPNRDILAFFCHFGLECVLLSRLMDVSPMNLWHHTCAAPSSVTSLYTEERRQGIAIFRMNYFGSISHLETAGEPASFSARFCETWDDMSERHD